MNQKLLFFLFLSCLAGIMPRCKGQQDTGETKIKHHSSPRALATIDSLMNLGLYQSALPLAEKLLARAIDQNDPVTAIRALEHQLNCLPHLDTEPEQKIWPMYKKAIESAEFPTANLLASNAASYLWGYHSSNYWRILPVKTTTSDEDIRLWSSEEFITKTGSLYQKALSEPEQLFNLPWNYFEPLITGDSLSCAPHVTLLDLLTEQASEFYLGTEANISPLQQVVNQPSLLMQGTEAFLSIQPKAIPGSYWKPAIESWQKLTELHALTGGQPGMAAVTLSRMSHFGRLSELQEWKEEVYIESLKKLQSEFDDELALGQVWLALAENLENKGQSLSYNNPEGKSNSAFAEAIGFCKKVQAIENCPETLCAPCAAIESRIRRMELNFVTETVIPSGEHWKLLINHRNIEECYYQVVPFDYEEYREILNLRDRKEQVHKIVSQAKLRDLHHRIPLNNEGDYMRHALEAVHNPLSPGFYVIIASPTRVVSYERSTAVINPLWVSDIAWTSLSHSNRSQEFRFVDRNSGKTLYDVQVEVYEESYHPYQKKQELKLLEKIDVNESGEVTIPAGSKDRRIRIKAMRGKQFIWDERSFFQSASQSQRLPYSQVHFFTDRKVYRPGQTVHFKGIAVEYNDEQRRPHTNLNETVTLYDVNSQEVAKLSLTTNDFGSYQGSFELPETGITGMFRIQSRRGSHYFSVEEYKRPTFTVKMHDLDSAYGLGEEVLVTGSATALSGFPIAQAEVNFRVKRAAERMMWGRGGWPVPGPEIEIAAGRVTSDNNGQFQLNFNASPPARPNFPNEHYRYDVEVDVVDISGESHSASQHLRIGKVPLVLGSDLPERVLSASFQQPAVLATNLNGFAVTASGTARVYRLHMPGKPQRERVWRTPDQFQLSDSAHRELFPDDVYREPLDIMAASVGDQVYQTEFNTAESGRLSFSNYKDWPSGWYVLKLHATASNGQQVSFERRFTWLDTSDKAPLPANFLWSHIAPAKAEPGQEIELYLSSAIEATVIVEVEVKEEIVQRQEIRLNQQLTSIKIPVTEACRGNFGIHVHSVYRNRFYRESHTVEVPYSNKKLQIEWETFRDQLLPGSNEQWRAKITGPDGEPFTAELLAGMYDASLDAMGFSNHWSLNPFVIRRPRAIRTGGAFAANGGWQLEMNWNPIERYYAPDPCRLKPSFLRSYARHGGILAAENMMKDDDAGTRVLMDGEENVVEEEAEVSVLPKQGTAVIPLRTNFNETAFFMPALVSDKDGKVELEFTLPESLTTWKWMLFAHGKQLEIGGAEGEVVASKPLMVIPNSPRFLRQGDQLNYTAQVVNQTEKELSVEVELRFNAFGAEADLSSQMLKSPPIQKITLKPAERRAVSWTVVVPEIAGMVEATVSASSSNFTDGERRPLPVLSNRAFVTETMPFALFGKGQSTFVLENLKNYQSANGATHHALTFEFSANPTWYAVQALPYIMEYPHECSEQIFSRFYANTLAGHIVQSKPAIAEMFRRHAQESPEALWSNLNKNEELKQVLLEETPWVLQAQNESEARQRIALLFELDRMQQEQQKALLKLAEAQLPDGSWPWFKGMQPDRFITQYIVEGLGRLGHLGTSLQNKAKVEQMISNALRYLDKALVEDLRRREANEDETLTNLDVQFLYLRSFYPDYTPGKAVAESMEKLWRIADKHWVKSGLYAQTMLATAAIRSGKSEIFERIIASITERSIFDQNKGRFWTMPGGWQWHQRPVETQSALIELYTESGEGSRWINEMRYWLLSQKQVQHWKTTTATANACYAMLLRGDEWLEINEWPEISVGNYNVNYFEGTLNENAVIVAPEPATGHFKTRWDAERIKPEMASIVVSNPNEAPAWGALYWQYFQDMDKVDAHGTFLRIDRDIQVARVSNGKTEYIPVSETNIVPGDRLRVRLVVETDRTMNYIHLSDRRAAGLEPVDVRSGYQYSGQIGYYAAVKDAAQHFFIQNLPEGRHVIEYELRANLRGDFSHGFSEIQCMYAPEFSAKTKGLRLLVE